MANNNNQRGLNRAFDAHVVDLREMDEIIVRAKTDSSRDWVEHRKKEVMDGINDSIENLREGFEEMTCLHRAGGGNPNDNSQFSDIFLGLAINVGDGHGRHNPWAYSMHPDGVSPAMISSVAGIDTVDPDGTRERANRVRDAVLMRDNLHKYLAMRNVAQQRLNVLAASIEFKGVENVVAPTDEEVNEAIAVIRRGVKRRRLNPEEIIRRAYEDPDSIFQEED